MFLNDIDEHDNHCRLTFLGENWWIRAVYGKLILLSNENGRTVLDTRNVDWSAYADAAVAMMDLELAKATRAIDVFDPSGRRSVALTISGTPR